MPQGERPPSPSEPIEVRAERRRAFLWKLFLALTALNAAVIVAQHTRPRLEKETPGLSEPVSPLENKNPKQAVQPRIEVPPPAQQRIPEIQTESAALQEALEAAISYFQQHARNEIPALKPNADARTLCTFNDNWYRNTKATIDGLPTHKHLQAAWGYIESRGIEPDPIFIDGLRDAGHIVGNVNVFVESIPFGRSAVGTFPTDPTGLRATITAALAKTPRQKSSCGMIFNSIFAHLESSRSTELIAHAITKMMLGMLVMLKSDLDNSDRAPRAAQASFHLLSAIEAALPAKR